MMPGNNLSAVQVVSGIAGFIFLISWIVSGTLLSGVAALILLLGMAGGALLYRFDVPRTRTIASADADADTSIGGP